MSNASGVVLSASEKQDYLSLLRAEVQRITPGLVARWGQLGYDLADEALGFVWEKIEGGQYDPQRGPFCPWCRKVLRNLLITLARRARSKAKHETLTDFSAGRAFHQAATAHSVPREIRRRELQVFETAPFSEGDLCLIRQWSPLDRAVLLSLSGLWRKVPADDWARWLRAAAPNFGSRGAFPAARLLACQCPRQRQSIVADSLGIRPNTVSQRWRRNWHLLEELECIASLFEAV